MNLTDIAKTVGQYAPLLGTVVGFPQAGLFLNMIANAFGSDPKSPDDLLMKIQQDPDAPIKLKQIENSHLEMLQQLAYSENNLFLTDVQNARKTELDRNKYGWMLPVLGIMITLGFFSIIIGIMLSTMDKSDHDVLYMMLGALGTSWGTVVQYYFGSSHALQKISAALESKFK